MKRRNFLLAGSAAAASSLAAPRLSLAQDAKVLRFVPQANLSSLDSVAGTQYVVRNASLLVWDTLFGVDHTITPRPQMVEAYDVSPDYTDWTFKLRPGLTFHDGEPVRGRDVIASLQRWMVRDTMGQRIKATLLEFTTPDDRTVKLKLSKPFPKMLFALGKQNAPVALIMPERIAKTDPFKLITEYVGSGPMVFQKDQWVPGSKAVFTKFAGYQPRPEPGDWLAGGKRVEFDRIEWLILPDDATKAAALQNGEIDWWENPIPDLVPLLKKNRNLNVAIGDDLGNIGSFRMNHLWPPFNDVRARQAVMMALNQEDYMRAVVGDDEALWKRLPSFFTPGTPFATDAGGDILKGPRRYDEAKKLLAEAGYKGEKIVLLVATDISITKAQGDVTADLLGKIGMNVDYQALDWGTVGARRAKKEAPAEGGWNIFHTWHAGADCINPAPYTALDA
ncbi:MAG: ABC transporter substrate-binding protein, partial [Acetobacteraceae bacterium]|nr:ABC transporter substrate-binding protein [Acetobacteraceae bacterium]